MFFFVPFVEHQIPITFQRFSLLFLNIFPEWWQLCKCFASQRCSQLKWFSLHWCTLSRFIFGIFLMWLQWSGVLCESRVGAKLTVSDNCIIIYMERTSRPSKEKRHCYFNWLSDKNMCAILNSAWSSDESRFQDPRSLVPPSVSSCDACTFFPYRHRQLPSHLVIKAWMTTFPAVEVGQNWSYHSRPKTPQKHIIYWPCWATLTTVRNLGVLFRIGLWTPTGMFHGLPISTLQ